MNKQSIKFDYKWKKDRWTAWDLNLGLNDGGPRRTLRPLKKDLIFTKPFLPQN